MVDKLIREQMSPLHLFLTGMLCIPGYLIQYNVWVRLAEVLLFAFLATLNGKKIKWTYFFFMVASITVFNLLTPVGQVLYRLGPFTITAGALEQGILKGLTIVGLVFISLFSIRPDLRLPGRLGGLIGRVFLYYEHILEGKRKIEARNLIPSIDTILDGLFTPGEQAPEPAAGASTTSAAGYVFAVALLGLVWGSLFLR
jgi:heptaprenyl diphosphate synthase